jgi:hypothetical protein
VKASSSNAVSVEAWIVNADQFSLQTTNFVADVVPSAIL